MPQALIPPRNVVPRPTAEPEEETRMESAMSRVGLAVIGAGYWGPNLVRNFHGHARLGPALALRPGRGPGPRGARPVLDGARRRLASTRSSPTRRRRRGRHRHAGGHPLRRSRWPRSRPASTCWSRSRWRLRSTTGGSSSRPPSERGRVLMCDHTYCYTPAVQHIRELVARGRARRPPVSSTRSGSTSAWSSPTSTCSGTSRRTTCRSSTSSCPAASRRSRSPRTAPTRSAPGRPASAT